MKNNRSKTGLVVVITIVAVIFAVWFYGRGGNASSELSPEQPSVNREFIILLDQVSSIKIDKSVFADPVFQSLRDSTVILSPLPTGRINPFEPLFKESSLPSRR